MTMEQPALWSLNGLASELGLDRRTLAKRLRGVPPDGDRNGNPAWKMQTVLDALRRAEGARDRSGRYANTVALTAIERAEGNVESFLAKLRGEPSVERRRGIVQSEGYLVGQLDRLLEKSIAGRRSAAAVVIGPFRDRVVAAAVAEITTLCGWRIAS